MPNGRCHAVIDRLIDDDDRQKAAIRFPDVFAGPHDGIAVEAVDDDVAVIVFVPDGDDRLRISVVLDRRVKQLHFLLRDGVRVVVVGEDFFDRDQPDESDRVRAFGQLMGELLQSVQECRPIPGLLQFQPDQRFDFRRQRLRVLV